MTRFSKYLEMLKIKMFIYLFAAGKKISIEQMNRIESSLNQRKKTKQKQTEYY